ncbi:hypothetical protein [Pseudaminobacter salicylatoxidans]|uniref:hypothetical protein n=1 Tax=Pseudaminobacter salicylatoxidans TaxID=93369 RepID=UPI003CC74140
MRYRPLHDWVLIERDPRVEFVGSIFLPPHCRDKGRTGTVVARGPKVTDVASGDRVWAPLHCGIDVVLGNRTFWQIRECEIGIVL